MASLIKGDAEGLELAAQTHIWNHIFNFINSMSLKCALQLGIPDIIHKHGQPMLLHQLIHSLPIDHAKSQPLHRLMRILVHSGFFLKEKVPGNDGEEEGYSLTPSSKLLLKDNPSSVTPFLLAMLDPLLVDPWQQLSQWFQTSDDVNPFYTCHGASLWELAGLDPRLNQFFNEGMTSDSRLVSSVLMKSCKEVFLGLNSVVDVGGGTGVLAQSLAEAFPHLKCTVLDLPHVVDGLESSIQNLEYVGGDMFVAIPPADAVLFKWILHDWSDKECVQILKKCKEAIPSKEKGGKVIILDMVMKAAAAAEGGGDNNVRDNTCEAIETQLCYDMLMLVLTTGKERNEKEWANIFFEAGFHSYNIIPVLGLRSLIELYY